MWFKQPSHRLILLLMAVVGLSLLVIRASNTRVVAAAAGESFIDPTASVENAVYVLMGHLVYVGPFAKLTAGPVAARSISIGNESDVQDGATLDASEAPVTIGDLAIVAHGGTVRGAGNFAASVGVGGKCPAGSADCPSFVSFNALVEGAIIQKDAMVSALARVGPGVTITSGLKVLPGKNVTSNSQVNLTSGKLAQVTDADRDFMRGVIEVNTCLAAQYAALFADDPSNVLGINYDPGRCPAFNPTRDLPQIGAAKTVTRDPSFRNRIIGDIRLLDSRADLDRVMGSRISLRADEGEPFEVGSIASMAEGVIFHALEHSKLRMGNGGNYGVRSIVHGGPTAFNDTTITGDNFTLGAESVFFRSRIGNNSRVGFKSLVQQSDVPANSVIGDRRLLIENLAAGNVEW